MVDAFNMTAMRPHRMLAETAEAGASLSSMSTALTDQPSERWVTDGVATFVVVNEQGFAVNALVNQIALLYTDIAPGGSIRVRTYDGANNLTFDHHLTGEAEPGSLSAPPGYRHLFFHMLDGSRTVMRVVVNTSSSFRVGRLAVGQALQVEHNADYGSTSWGYEEAPEPQTLDSGVTILEELPAAPYFEFQLTWASEAEMETWWQRFGALQWQRRPVLVVRRPDPNPYRHSGIFWGVLRLRPFVAAEFDMFEVSGKVRSMV